MTWFYHCYSIVILLQVCFICQVFCDLPVHCVGDQVYGEWTFYLGASGYTNSLSCGHSKPDNPKENYQIKPHSFKVMKEYKITLFSNNTMVDEHGNMGFWTMIYDEGFEVRVAGRSYFAFSKFIPRPDMGTHFNSLDLTSESDDSQNYQSICSETIDGWYHFNNITDWGCYYGIKSIQSENNGEIVKSKDIEGPTGPPKNSVTDFVEEEEESSPSSDNSDSFLEFSQYRINQVNSDSSKLWKARQYPEYSGMSLLELGSMIGVSGRKSLKVSSVRDDRADPVKYKSLPEAFDWRDVNGASYIPHPRKQGSCGSCYAMAATQMIESRIRIITNNAIQVQLSPQSILSCSAYAQGCDGGFPYLVGKYGQDYGFLEESCLPYQPKKALCSWRCQNPKIWYTENYHYVGGAYGKCSEIEMMKEIYEKGPIIVGFNAPQDLFWYSEGVYHQEGEELDSSSYLQESIGIPVNSKKIQHAFFEKTNHAVLAIGWGFDMTLGKKYWIVQNTWGDDWGQEGYFRIVRGEDMCSFEAMAVAFDPVVPGYSYNTTKIQKDSSNSKGKIQENTSSQKVVAAPETLPLPLAQRVQIDEHPQVITTAQNLAEEIQKNKQAKEGQQTVALELAEGFSSGKIRLPTRSELKQNKLKPIVDLEKNEDDSDNLEHHQTSEHHHSSHHHTSEHHHPSHHKQHHHH